MFINPYKNRLPLFLFLELSITVVLVGFIIFAIRTNQHFNTIALLASLIFLIRYIEKPKKVGNLLLFLIILSTWLGIRFT
ncbi:MULTISPECIES: hypothetical protein [Aneurinibacillus]|uniref:Uncharacterized protein n=1 Tax=Aneurinibacillus thermoaerophilus TaxID=143495 RepID=A0A1G8FUS0_ANETH|nr:MULTISPECIES: hypothetical protein [Aneurinibacillus]AMA74120.1 hypothetical protein ACH33_15710 [Aneurinibacillus sp. XH2]MED0675499.1 hypothetical protein [Aneurinibacillus thermoaerophilus]MED0678855.1 hypothetical protein [Aneurinibacillus thermoaerophilus]MED0738806.1 hypothetical protein [Aneurinibacillus thermoaerophilus]MED0758382.1 hypothetical protein [Aneurinibacillus thermoaerophilus]